MRGSNSDDLRAINKSLKAQFFPDEALLMESLFRLSIASLRSLPIRKRRYSSHEKEKLLHAIDSWDWVNRENDYEYPFSFANVCKILGYNTQEIRAIIYSDLQERRLLQRYERGILQHEDIF